VPALDKIQPRFSVDKELHRKMKILAAAEDKELQTVYEEAIAEKLQREQNKLEQILTK
jgi:predicted transcriptional regulator